MIQDPLLSWRRRRDSISTVAFESRSRYVLTVLWIMATLLIAMFVPDISKVISVIGGISAFFIFIFPGNSLVLYTHILCYPLVLQLLNPVMCLNRTLSDVCHAV